MENIDPDLLRYVKDFIPILDYQFEYVRGNMKVWECQFRCDFKEIDQVENFIKSYLQTNHETLKINVDKKCGEKSPYLLNRFYRCHHGTRYEKTRDNKLLQNNPNKRFKNTHCPYTMSVKIEKSKISLACVVSIKHEHNHPVIALESFSFKSITDNVLETIRKLFEDNLTPSLVYFEYIQLLRREAKDELDFHEKKLIVHFALGEEILIFYIKSFVMRNLVLEMVKKCF